MAAQLQRREARGECEEHEAETVAVGDRDRWDGPGESVEEGDRGTELQHVAGDARQHARLPQPDPDEGRAFERPGSGGPAGVERQRDRQRREEQRERRERRDEQGLGGVVPATDMLCGGHVDRAGDERRERGTVLEVRDEPDLQREGRERESEDERAVEGAFTAIGSVAGEERRDREVRDEERREEGLRRRPEVRPVEARAPRGADREREREAGEVQHAPRPARGDRDDPGVQDGVVAEQRDVIARAGRREHRREEAAGRPEDGEALGLLAQREDRGARGDHGQQSEREAGGQQGVEPQGREDREIHDPDAAALQRDGEPGASAAQPPAERRECHPGEHGAADPEFRRDVGVVVREFQEEGDAEEQHDDADPDDRVAAREPAERRGDPGGGLRGRCPPRVGQRRFGGGVGWQRIRHVRCLR